MKKWKKQLKFGKNFFRLNSKGGGSGFLLVLFIFIFAMGVYLTFLAIVKGQHRVASGHRDETIAMEMADAAMDQALSKIRSHAVSIPLEYPPSPSPTPSGIPMTITIPVGVDAYSTTAYAVVSFVYNLSPTPGPLRDIEGNLKYRIRAVVDNATGIGTNVKLKIRRGVSCDFVLVNFGRYLGYIFSDDNKSVAQIDGPYHVNGTVSITSNTDWNNATLCVNSGGAANPFYDPTYTTVASNNIVAAGTVKSGTCQVVNSTGGSFSTLPNTSAPLGTWFDGAHGGFKVSPPIIPDTISSLAHVVIQSNLLSSANIYTLQGAGLVGAGPQTLPGLSGGVTYNAMMNESAPWNTAGLTAFTSSPVSNLVRINLSALNSGYTDNNPINGNIQDYYPGDGLLGDTDAHAATNYDAALTSSNGLIIYVQGNVAVWGKLPDDVIGGVTMPGNNNKKVTIVATGDVEICGDVAVSDSPYASGSQTSCTAIDPNPLVNNPNDDAIAIISGGSKMFIDAWFGGNPSYFIHPDTLFGNCGCLTGSPAVSCQHNGQMRIDAFLYCPAGTTGGSSGTQTYEAGTCGATGGCNTIGLFVYHGAISVNGSSGLPACNYKRAYDPSLKFNLSDVIPSGTLFNAYQDIEDFTGLP